MGLLYKVKKIKLQRKMVDKEAKIYGPYVPVTVKTDYRTNKNAVTLARRAADSGNANADRYDAQHPQHEHGYAARHTVEVEVCETPDFIEYGKVEGKTPKETEQNIAAWRSGSASPWHGGGRQFNPGSGYGDGLVSSTGRPTNGTR